MFRYRDEDGRRRSPAAAILIAALASVLSFSPAARADPVNEFNVQLKDIKPGGSYTIVYTANTYDTTGERPPQMTSNSLRLASGVTIRRPFLRSRYRCDVPRMRDIVLENPERSPVRSKRFANLAATLDRIRDELTPAEVAVVEHCVRARIGQGVAVADARPFTLDPVPAKLTLYLAKATEKGAIASIGVIAVLDERAKPYREKRLLRLLGALSFSANIFEESSAGGRYGYRLALPTPPIGLVLDVKISLAEVRVTVSGLTRETKVVSCVRRAGGRCREKKVTTQRTFWLTQPKCPATSRLGFEASYTYETGLQMARKIEVPCPRFHP
jgi:hypothetical protein